MTGTSVKLIDNQDGPDLEFQAVSKPLDIVEVLRLMPPQSQILQYAVLKDSLLIWVVSKDGVAPARAQRIAIGDLNMRVDSFRRLASSASESELEEFSRESVALYDLLVNPVIDLLDTSKQLCIVPDKVLNYLPFPALKSSVTGRYFVDQQENGLVMSASSSLFIRSSGYANEKASTNRERLLCIGDPLFDAKEFPHLNRLQSAATEAQIVSTYYGPFPPLVGATATKRRVMSEMEKSDVIHLATHAIIDETYPIRSKLLLAKSTTDLSGEESGILQAYEIFRLNLSRTKLVVLSACQTGIGKYYADEGMIGLSRAFIAKRIPLVVASLWAVDSSATARLMIAFHKHRKLDAPQTALALRRAQLEMLTSSNDSDRLPRNWAAFVAIGGYAEF
jgi:CHAT domain-containing protein